jgi:Cdc25 family phosphatase
MSHSHEDVDNSDISFVTAETVADFVKSGLTENKVTIVDVRTPEEFETGAVKGAINVPNDKFQSNEAIDSLIATVYSSNTIIFHCAKSLQRGPSASRLFSKRLEETKSENTPTMYNKFIISYLIYLSQYDILIL